MRSLCAYSTVGVCIIVFLFSNLLFSQGKIRLINNATIKFGANAILTIADGNANAIQTGSGGGNIISENENRQIKWKIGTNIETYTVPFTTTGGTKIPLTLQITGAGSGSGYILFSTYGGLGWDNNTYKPSGVTHMNSLSSGGTANNSDKVIDRFWIIDAQGYTTKPTVTITFTYADAEWSASGNSITESNLFAQRWNSSLNKWADWFGPTGTCNTTNNTVSSGSVSPANFFRAWTLVDASSPLPLELLTFKAECENNKINLLWQTASEYNIAYYTIERSFDCNTWDSITSITASSFSNEIITYNYFDFIDDKDYLYYRLKIVENDNSYYYSDLISVYCNNKDIEIIEIFPNPAEDYFYFTVCSSKDREVEVKLFNIEGKYVINQTLFIHEGISTWYIDTKKLAAATYYLSIFTTDNLSKDSKIVVVKK
ncbi:MAG: T9SS type A sorting domain-containing protein [Bacteroidales bacterium]|nr:T9SS type A sorting domain-containing protein [Bacteroidales bacterium]